MTLEIAISSLLARDVMKGVGNSSSLLPWGWFFISDEVIKRFRGGNNERLNNFLFHFKLEEPLFRWWTAFRLSHRLYVNVLILKGLARKNKHSLQLW